MNPSADSYISPTFIRKLVLGWLLYGKCNLLFILVWEKSVAILFLLG